jgi:hypothetical protein
MAKIESGATADLLTVDPASKAARVTLYDAAGAPMHPADNARGTALIKVRQTAATGAGAAVWAIRNPSATRTVVIKRLALRCFFDGTAAATLMRYELIKGTGVTAFSGGAVVSPLIKRTAMAPTAEVRVLDTGLTLTGVSWGGPGHEIIHGRVTQATTVFVSTQDILDFAEIDIENIELATNEVLAIRNVVVAVIGDNILGHCDFDART